MPPSSLELSDNNPKMEEASDEEREPLLVSVHDDVTMKQAQAHSDVVMAREQSTKVSVSAFRHV